MARHKKARNTLTAKQRRAVRAGILAAPISAGFMLTTAANASADESLPPAQSGPTFEDRQKHFGDQNFWTNPLWWHQINDPSLSSFTQQSKLNNPTGQDKPSLIKDGVDWSNDGCTAGGQAANRACVRHDANTRTLQHYPGYWNEFNYRHATQDQFDRDLDQEVKDENIGGPRKQVYLAGTYAASDIPGIFPDWHGGKQEYIRLTPFDGEINQGKIALAMNALGQQHPDWTTEQKRSYVQDLATKMSAGSTDPNAWQDFVLPAAQSILQYDKDNHGSTYQVESFLKEHGVQDGERLKTLIGEAKTDRVSASQVYNGILQEANNHQADPAPTAAAQNDQTVKQTIGQVAQTLNQPQAWAQANNHQADPAPTAAAQNDQTVKQTIGQVAQTLNQPQAWAQANNHQADPAPTAAAQNDQTVKQTIGQVAQTLNQPQAWAQANNHQADPAPTAAAQNDQTVNQTIGQVAQTLNQPQAWAQANNHQADPAPTAAAQNDQTVKQTIGQVAQTLNQPQAWAQPQDQPAPAPAGFNNGESSGFGTTSGGPVTGM
ncbi:hypothetical protein ABIE67_010183 [Streptomyces sp. V4I8]|uniref:hypothetical protein n=1 Tax=Streptomyces sp. V4I8 TaxID=3156469 RepID=UPI003514AF8E